MGTPKYAERVVRVETRLDTFLDEQFPQFRKDLEKSLVALGEKIDNAQLNGQTGRVKNMAVVLGDSEDVQILASVVESHKRWRWALGPFAHARQGVVNAALWIGTGLVVGGLNAAVHARWPQIP